MKTNKMLLLLTVLFMNTNTQSKGIFTSDINCNRNEKIAAYISLTELCMPDSPRKNEVLSFIEDLRNYNNETDQTIYTELRMFLNRNLISFIITLDWKESVNEFESWVSDGTKDNFNKTFQFDRKDIYDDDSSVSDDGLFAAFDSQLHKIGLQITMIETDGDEYHLIIHPISASDAIIHAMQTIGIPLASIPD